MRPSFKKVTITNSKGKVVWSNDHSTPAEKPAPKAEPEPTQIPVGNLSNKCALDIAAAKTTGELVGIYNAYATTEPIADLKAACAAMRKQLESGNNAE